MAEIVYDHVQSAEISDEKLDGNLTVQFYPHPRQNSGSFLFMKQWKRLKRPNRNSSAKMLNDQGFEILISSDLQYKELCSEIYFEDQYVAIITRENGLENAIIEIAPPSNSENWTFDCVRFLKTVKQATSTLIRTDETPKPNKKSPNLGKFKVSLKETEAQIFYDHLCLGEISEESKGLILQFNGKSLGTCSIFRVDEIISAITIPGVIQESGDDKEAP